ncbi:hypothetical protein BJF90_02155 [Pseudonocardia sp. CNS-004]|nr:hypothetical protein BJF90_02155 [Pseudonocardia sp. CNS-004]
MSVVADTVPDLRPVRPARPGRPRLTRSGRWALAGLLLGTATLHLWDLGSVGWADIRYASAIRGMAQDWTAFLYASTDAGNIVTVGGPPGSLWAMALFARVFGFSAWSMLVPQALMGVGAVALLYAAVRRVAGPGGGLLAGAALALTPVTVAMFRFNYPDALLVLLLVAAAYSTVRAIEDGLLRRLLLAGVFAGLAVLTDTAQALLPLPALALAYLVAAPVGFFRRGFQLLAAGVALVVAAGWWYALVELRLAGNRPYIGGSRADSALELALDDLRRLAGIDPGPLRMVDVQHAALVGWLLPAALALLVVGLLLTSRRPRTDAARASLVLWGGWTVLTAVALGTGGYLTHDTVALAPGVAALAGIGSALLWERRRRWAGRGTLTVLVAGTVAWEWTLLDRMPALLPRWIVVAAAAVVIGFVLIAGTTMRRGTAAVGSALALMALALPAAVAARTTAGQVGLPDVGAQASAPGPELTDVLRSTGRTWSAATVGTQQSAALGLASDTTVIGIGGASGNDPAPTLERFQAIVEAGEVRWFVDTGGESEILAWVRQNFEPSTVGGHTVYDFARPAS